jgi:predicted dehydrogenase
MARILGFGIAGAGHIAPLYAKAIQASSGGRLLAVSDVDAGRAGKLAQEFGARTCASLEEMLGDPEIHVVSVLTPTHLHHEAVMQCARAKRHVIVEQPPVLSLAEMDGMLQVCAKKKTKVACPTHFRASPGIQTLKTAISTGRFGRLLQVGASVKLFHATEYYFSEPWLSSRRSGAGVTLLHAFPYIDLLLDLAGPLTRLIARMANLNHPSVEVEDSLLACLRFASGAEGVLQASTALWPGTDARIEINGTNGAAVLSGARMTTWRFRDELPEDEAIRTSAPPSLPPDAPGTDTVAIAAVIQDMIDAVHAKRDVSTPVRCVRPALEAALAMYQSAARSAPVDFPVHDDPTIWEEPARA